MSKINRQHSRQNLRQSQDFARSPRFDADLQRPIDDMIEPCAKENGVGLPRRKSGCR